MFEKEWLGRQAWLIRSSKAAQIGKQGTYYVHHLTDKEN